ncbi:YadA-like family protein [Pantoea sp. BAV 3049]|uniref:YadA-like family protein n=1 Tax=Pantoea sp. BAV 3049 TaxID=2654188 RepID=UPI00131D1D57|nr:YadA-like family protein [Pantoea sp. BAV 3049]
MKTTTFKLAAIALAVTFSHAAMATNTVDTDFTGTTIFAGDGNSVTGTPRNSANADYPQDIIGNSNTLVDSDSSTLYGDKNTLNKSDVVVMGQYNNIANTYGNVYGDGNTVDTGTSFGSANVFGNGSVISGSDNTVMGSHSSVTGNKSTVTGDATTVTGDNVTSSGYGNTVSGDGATVVGTNSTATSATNGIGLGTGTTVTDEDSIAIGTGASASNGAIAIGSGSIATGANSVSFGSSGNERQLTNVAAGTAGTDAVNLNQLNDGMTTVINEAKNYTDTKISEVNETINQTSIDNRQYTDDSVNNMSTDDRQYTDNSVKQMSIDDRQYTDQRSYQAEVNANNYTDLKYQQSTAYTDASIYNLDNKYNARFSDLKKQIGKVERKLNAGIAGVTAIASIPYVAEDNFSYGIGLGNYQNGNAAAAGVQYKTSLNTNVRVNVSWDSSHNNALGVGFAGGW